MPAGKVPAELLREVLEALPKGDERVILGPGIGRDSAVLRFREDCLVVSSDPITFATEEIGWYAVHINANDVATTGARPRWFFPTVLLPEKTADQGMFRLIMKQISEACSQLGITVCGGHSEITLSLDRPIVVGTMLGEVGMERLVRQDGARAGDKVLLTKGLAIEGTAVLAREHPEVRKALPKERLRTCERFIYEPGISIVEEALMAVQEAHVTSMHDPTEGGLAAGLHELAEASGVGIKINRQAVYVYEETRLVCEMLSLDPLGLLASGALLITVPPEQGESLVRSIRGKGIDCRIIGEITGQSGVVLLEDNGEIMELRPPPRDELARALEIYET